MGIYAFPERKLLAAIPPYQAHCDPAQLGIILCIAETMRRATKDLLFTPCFPSTSFSFKNFEDEPWKRVEVIDDVLCPEAEETFREPQNLDDAENSSLAGFFIVLL